MKQTNFNNQTPLVPFWKAFEAMEQGKRVAHQSWQNGRFVWIRPADTLPQDIIQRAVSIPQTVKDFLADKGSVRFFFSSSRD